MSIDGEVHGIRLIDADVPGFRASGIAVSSDGQTIYVTATTPQGGVLMSVPAFRARGSSQLFALAQRARMAASMSDFGTFVFSLDFTPAQGLGPLFNGPSCATCHDSPARGGMGLDPGQDEQLVGRLRADGSFDPLAGHGGPTARMHSVSELGEPCNLTPGIPPDAEFTSLRNAMSLRGNTLLDTIAPGDVLA
ncbi:MAG: hypothetical protein NTY02_20175, partial [Acidobacteria bacterium]|nr:hypothetical protein [Acidobacteriota bacterium]